MTSSIKLMREAIALSQHNLKNNHGGPFGAIIVKNGKIIGRGYNRVPELNDPTAHAEIVAIRDGCRKLKNFQLKNCRIYISCEPCPMCLAAIYWAGITKIYHAADRRDAAAIGFADQFIYEEINRPINKRKIKMTRLLKKEAREIMRQWQENPNKIMY